MKIVWTLLILISCVAALSVSASGQTRHVSIPYEDYIILVPVKADPPIDPPDPTVIVSNLNDSGAGSLRDAAARVPANGRIEIQVAGPIELTSGQIVLPRSATIVGTAGIVTINAKSSSRCMLVNGNLTAVNLSFANGLVATGAARSGGGLHVEGTLSLTNGTTTGSIARGPDQANGGGIFVRGNAVLNSHTVSGNRAESPPQSDSVIRGGGIFTQGKLTLNAGSDITSNQANGASSPSSTIRGGGVHTLGGLTVQGRVMVNLNTAIGGTVDGGGIYYGGGDAKVDGLVCTGNVADAIGVPAGGAVRGSCLLGLEGGNFQNSDFTSNRAKGFLASGGGLYLAKHVSMTNNHIQDNDLEATASCPKCSPGLPPTRAAKGGGAFFMGGATLVGGMVTGNTARAPASDAISLGGGLWLDTAPSINGTTISGNTADECPNLRGVGVCQ